jgi:quercetin dioxygenase-like cupin family protein
VAVRRAGTLQKTLTRIKALSLAISESHLVNREPLTQPGEWRLVFLPEETQFAADGIVSKTLFRSGAQRVTLFGFAAGQELSEHTSTSHALVQILTGSSEWTLKGEPRTLKAGDFLYMPPGLRHSVRATEPFSMMLTLLPPSEAPIVLKRFPTLSNAPALS